MEPKNILPNVVWINRAQLFQKIKNKETFVIYHSLQNCPDCGRLDQTFLQYYLKEHQRNQPLYRVEVYPWRQFKNHENPQLAQKWDAYVADFLLGFYYHSRKEESAASFAHMSARIPALQAWENGQLKEMVVYYNDRFSSDDWPKTILGSFFEDGPIGKEFADYYAYTSSKTLLAFYNQKISLFLDTYLL